MATVLPEAVGYVYLRAFSRGSHLLMFKMSPSALSLTVLFVCVLAVVAQSYNDDMVADKRAMRNALVRFGRASGGARNALVRFGKRSSDYASDMYESAGLQDKRTGAPQPFVRFGRSGQIEHMHDILSTLQKLQMANSL